jgi:hypothetical protein
MVSYFVHDGGRAGNETKNIAPIIGGAVGGCLLLLGIIALVCFLRKRQQRSPREVLNPQPEMNALGSTPVSTIKTVNPDPSRRVARQGNKSSLSLYPSIPYRNSVAESINGSSIESLTKAPPSRRLSDARSALSASGKHVPSPRPFSISSASSSRSDRLSAMITSQRFQTIGALSDNSHSLGEHTNVSRNGSISTGSEVLPQAGSSSSDHSNNLPKGARSPISPTTSSDSHEKRVFP